MGGPAPAAAARFAAFSFVDRITGLEPGRRVQGCFHVPSTLAEFPPCLAAEAVGQLAAWAAMARVGFRSRPVAALAGETRFHGAIEPGADLDLAVEIERCDEESIAYGGRACAGGRDVLDLAHCLGPMMPMDDYDDPAAVRDRFALLAGPGAARDRFAGVALPPREVIAREPGQRLCARMAVPGSAPFFGDHFPRRPVFPATLLLESLIRLGVQLADETAQAHGEPPGYRARVVRNVKVRDWTLPGQRVELEARLRRPPAEGRAEIALAARVGERTVSTGQAELVRGGAE